MRLDDISELSQSSALDQGMAGLMNFAKVLGAYYRKLVDEGFAQEDAFSLVLQYQMLMITQAKTKENG